MKFEQELKEVNVGDVKATFKTYYKDGWRLVQMMAMMVVDKPG